MSAKVDGVRTPWGSIFLASAVLFLSSLQFTMYFSSTYPFMKEVDPSSPEGFFGWIIAIFSIGQMIASPPFGYFSNRVKNVRWPTAIGMIVCLVGNLLYAFSESLEGNTVKNHKWVMFAARFVMGFGAGYVSPLRAYFATCARAEDRAMSISLGTGSFTLGFVVGPALQGAFSFVGYPGFHRGIIYLNLYTAPSLFVVCALILCIILLLTVFEETYAGIASNKTRLDPLHALPKFDVISVILLIQNWFCVLFTNTAIEVLVAPVTMVYYGWTNADAVTYNGFLFAGSGGVSLACTILIGYYLTKIIDDRKMIIFGLILVLVYYIITFPYPTETHTLCPGAQNCLCHNQVMDNTTGRLVNETYSCAPGSWYYSTDRIPLEVLYGAFPLLSVGIAFISTPLSTHLAKVVGPRRQGTVQGFLMGAGSLARCIGPIFMSYSFEWYGPRAAWIVNMVIMVGAVIPWCFLYTRVTPLDPNPKLKPGQSFEYKRGTLYRF